MSAAISTFKVYPKLNDPLKFEFFESESFKNSIRTKVSSAFASLEKEFEETNPNTKTRQVFFKATKLAVDETINMLGTIIAHPHFQNQVVEVMCEQTKTILEKQAASLHEVYQHEISSILEKVTHEITTSCEKARLQFQEERKSDLAAIDFLTKKVKKLEQMILEKERIISELMRDKETLKKKNKALAEKILQLKKTNAATEELVLRINAMKKGNIATTAVNK